MIKRLRIKIICFTMVFVLIMLCGIFTTIFTFTAKNLANDSLQQMHALAGRPDLPADRKTNLQTKVPYLILQQTGPNTWTAHDNGYYDLSDRAFLGELLAAAADAGTPDGVLKEYNMRFARSEIPSLRYVFMDISAEQAVLQHLMRLSFLIGTASLVLFFGVSLLLAEVAVRPVARAWSAQKQFVADASHELKTPLAVIMTNAELLQEEGYPPEKHAQFQQNILSMSYQMRHLVEGLLELTRLDNIHPDTAPLDLSSLLEDTLLPFEPMFFEQDMELRSSLAPGLWVKGSASHLRQVLEIFLDNAMKYGDRGVVTVTLECSGNNALLKVENTGVPLSAAELKNIFLRFYRADPSRNRNGSYGLGLSIAQGIVHRHGGKIWAESLPQGNRFCVQLHLCAPEPPSQ